MTVKFDDWQEVVNHPDTYVTLAQDLRDKGACVIGWTDGDDSHHDILLTLCPPQHGTLRLGLRGRSCLFVSIMRYGAFGFDLSSVEPRHVRYIAEKLEQPESDTTRALTELINGVLAELGRVPMLLAQEGAAR